MLLAKINPPAKTTRQDGPFGEVKTINGDYMKIFAEKYELGADKCRFVALFGYLVPSGIDKFQFETIHRDSYEFTKEELENWGLDDSVIFYKVATKLNIQVVEIVEKELTNDF